MARPYIVLGIILASVGFFLALFSYIFIGSVPLTAVGLSTLILGFTSIGLANSRPKLSPEACQLFLKAGVKNTLAILEELEIKNKAIYLPRSMRQGHSEALIPFTAGGVRGFKEKLPGHMIIGYGANSEDKAIAVTTPGNISLDLLKSRPGCTADEIQSAMIYILTGVLDIAGGVKVDISDSTVNVEVSGAEMSNEEIFRKETLYSQCIGSPIASIAAAICSEALEKPIRITFETFHEGKANIMLEVLPVAPYFSIDLEVLPEAPNFSIDLELS